jgi:hypothetical protein
MSDRTGNLIALSRVHVAIAGAALSMLMITVGAGWPQAGLPPSSLGVQTPAQQAPPDRPALLQGEPSPSSSPPAGEENPGLFNEMGKLFEKSLSVFPTLKSPRETIEDLNSRAKEATKDAGDSLTRLAKPSSMVTGRMGCPVAANGAPDCKVGARPKASGRARASTPTRPRNAPQKCTCRAANASRVTAEPKIT